jgi:hypothetical protein
LLPLKSSRCKRAIRGARKSDFGAMKKAIQKAATSLALIVIVALGVRVAFAWDQARKIPPGVLGVVPFQQETGNIAYALAQGRGFSDVFRTDTGPTAWLAPVYPLLVAATFKIFGIFTARAFFACSGLNILFSSAACMPIFYAGKRVWGLGAASGAAWLWALFPNAILMPFEWIWDTSLSALLAATILWATLALAESERVRDWCGYGLLWGLTLMMNPALGSLLPFFLGWAAYQSRGESGAKWKRAGLAFGIMILCCVPWTIRNYADFHRLIPLRSNLPFELWLGNNDIFDPHALNGRKYITRTEEARTYTQMGETAYMREKWALATSFIESHPGLELRLTANKFVEFWMGTESPLKGFRETDSWLIRGILLCDFSSAIGALLGIIVMWERRKKITQRRGVHRDSAETEENSRSAGELERNAVFPLAVFPVIFPCLYYVTHADLRYRHPIDPVVLLLTAIFVAEVAGHFGVGLKETG